jgi:hypothetical protein
MTPRRLSGTIRLAALVLVAAAVLKELSKPPDEREWHGELAGFVPYELRPPTLGRVRERWWNPRDERILTPHVFGVGWSVNVGRIVELARRRGPG